jgi:CheY-like chemotaxis protein
MLRRVQERHGTGAIPVVMFSGTVGEDAQDRATSGGARGFVGKPFDLQQLVRQAKAIAPV